MTTGASIVEGLEGISSSITTAFGDVSVEVSQEVSDGIMDVGSGMQYVGISLITTGSSTLERVSKITMNDFQQTIPIEIPILNVSDMVPDLTTVPSDEAPETYQEDFPGQIRVGTHTTPQAF
mmetsp:Transcript_11218/g.14502  ORF Transcript_11218/g.14502 Transcript_11218/m.14502 type:complete len:122 (+) Transcript_11218:81-446(+)